jgi:pimeloyl-ACP methyl ester carboxylesterase
MKPREHLGRWRSQASEQRFRAVEDELWREAFPDPPEALDVETEAGTTRVYRWPGDGRPVVLLHGMGGTSLMWWDFVGQLGGRTVYAIDTMGDAGRSVHRRAFYGVADVAEWLQQAPRPHRRPGVGWMSHAGTRGRSSCVGTRRRSIRLIP